MAMTTQTLLLGYALAVAAIVVLVWRKYGTLFNPVTFFAGYYGVLTIAIPAWMLSVGLLGITRRAFVAAIWLSAAYFASIAVAYLAPVSPFRAPLEFVVSRSRPFTVLDVRDTSNPAIAYLVFQFLVAYALLMVFSHVGTLWLTDPREAYSFHRTAVGVWWSLAEASLMLLFLAAVFRWARGLRSALLLACLFMAVAYRLGSKAYTVVYLLMALLFVQFCRRKLSSWTFLLVGVLVLALVAGLLVLQGSVKNTQGILHFFDYFANSALFLSKFPNFRFRYGEITLSTLWYYVPRALYPAKPFSYGPNLLTAWMGISAAKGGFTPGLLPWMVGYADFGLLGVIAAGLFEGWISKAAFESFLASRNIESLAVLWQLGFFNIIVMFPNAPFPVFWLWFMLQGAVLWVVGSFVRQE